jgi:hypothetical protein
MPNPDAVRRTIVIMPAHSIVVTNDPSHMETFFDETLRAYVCSSSRCKHNKFFTAESFQAHLTTTIHVGGKVVCPLCLKKFDSTYAWVAHTESASKKCSIRNSVNFNQVMREVTGGLMGTEGFTNDGAVKFVTPKIEDWSNQQ